MLAHQPRHAYEKVVAITTIQKFVYLFADSFVLPIRMLQYVIPHLKIPPQGMDVVHYLSR